MQKTIVVLLLVCGLSACGGGSSNAGGMHAEVRGDKAGICITENVIDGANMVSTTEYINTCDYDVNVRDFPNLPVVFIAANTTVTVPGVQVFVGACAAPSFPEEGGAIDSYLCSII